MLSGPVPEGYYAGAAVPLASRVASPADAAVAPVVVIGGGMAGTTLAKYVRLWSGKSIPVTLDRRQRKAVRDFAGFCERSGGFRVD